MTRRQRLHCDAVRRVAAAATAAALHVMRCPRSTRLPLLPDLEIDGHGVLVRAATMRWAQHKVCTLGHRYTYRIRLTTLSMHQHGTVHAEKCSWAFVIYGMPGGPRIYLPPAEKVRHKPTICVMERRLRRTAPDWRRHWLAATEGRFEALRRRGKAAA